MNNNIFKKYDNTKQNDEKEQNTLTISKRDILNVIPDGAIHQEDPILKETKTEWRWIIYKFPHIKNQIIEISQKSPNCNRLCINKAGEWVESDNALLYQQYELERYYTYE
jgi:hypothetical protein